MSVNDFAHVGVFTIAMIGFALGTAFFGTMLSGLFFDDYNHIPLTSWILGVFVYGLTVMVMWRWR